MVFIALIFLFYFAQKPEKKLDFKINEDNKSLEINRSKSLIKGLFADFNQSQNSNKQNIFSTQQLFIKDDNLSLDTNKTSDLNASTQDVKFVLNEDKNSSIINQEQNSSPILADENLSQKDEKIQDDFAVRMIQKDKNAKLAIIIDDMASSYQVKQLKALNLKITPSFFPANKNHPNTPKLAKEFDFYMLHLPLEAKNFKEEELKTLRITDSFEEIDQFLRKIKQDFSDLVFINNHTGSAFTSDLEAMRRLLLSFRENGFIFVDSLTAGSSKGEKVMREFHQSPIVRDIFLDNVDDVQAIQKELLKAVKLAQKKGFAIAIGHPRKNTFKALAQSKELLDKVELVYLNQMFEKTNLKQNNE